MSRSNIAAVGFLLVYVAGAALLWKLAYDTTGDKSRASLIGAATAVTAGIAGIAGAWFTSWRASQLQEQQEYRALRRQLYGQVLVALSDFRQACNQVRVWVKVVAQAQTNEDRTVREASLLDAEKYKEQCHGVLSQTLAGVDLFGSPSVQSVVDTFREPLQSATANDKPEDSELATWSTNFINAARVMNDA
jgi:hypothetical protein